MRTENFQKHTYLISSQSVNTIYIILFVPHQIKIKICKQELTQSCSVIAKSQEQLKPSQNKKGRKFFQLHQKWCPFSQLLACMPAVKKTPFSVQLEKFFGPSYFVTPLEYHRVPKNTEKILLTKRKLHFDTCNSCIFNIVYIHIRPDTH